MRLRSITYAALAMVVACVMPAHALPTPCTHNQSWQQLVLSHVARYPKMEIADVYKLLHQATMGSEHAAPSREAAQSWMTSELRSMGVGPSEPVIDTLGRDGRIVRIHLRPFVTHNGNVNELLDDFLKTATQVRPDTSELRCALNASLALVQNKKIEMDAQALRTLIAERASAGFPAGHHSDAYEKLYKPAYRVISRDLAATLTYKHN